MARLIPDDIDFGAYARSTDAQAKVRKASDYAEQLEAAFLPPERRTRSPEMFSTKMRGLLEFRPGEVTVYAGYNGHRKSMFSGQVALDLCVQRERVLMMSLEMSPAQTLARMARQAFAAVRPRVDQTAEFSKWTDDRLWLFDHVGRLTPSQCLAVVRYFAEEIKGRHVMIDSMMMVCASEEHLDEQKQFVTDVVRSAQELGLHIHLIAHCRKPQSGDESRSPTKYDIRGSGAISDQSHNIAMIWANKGKRLALEADPTDADWIDKPDAMVSVEKQRNGAWEGRLLLWFDDASLRFVDKRGAVEPYVLNNEAERETTA
jgi:twinkle protein